MNAARLLSFAIPAAIIVFALAGSRLASAAERYAAERRRGNGTFWVRIGIALGVALLAIMAAIYGVNDLT